MVLQKYEKYKKNSVNIKSEIINKINTSLKQKSGKAKKKELSDYEYI